MKKVLFLTLLALSMNAFAGKDKEKKVPIEITLLTETGKAAGAKVVIYQDSTELKTLTTDKKGTVTTELTFGSFYKVQYSYKNCASMFFTLDARIPEAKITQDMGFGGEILLIDTTLAGNKKIKTKKFNYPYTKAFFNGKDGFTEDMVYKASFEKGIVKEMEEDIKKEKEKAKVIAQQKKADAAKQRTAVIAEAKQKLKFVGVFLFGEKGKRAKALKNKTVVLVDTKGVVLEKVKTNELGEFAFTQLPSDQNFLIQLEESDPSLANMQLTIASKNGKEISNTTADATGKAKVEFKQMDKVSTALLMPTGSKNTTDIKGKLIKDDGTSPIAGSKLNLVGDKGETVQSATSDETGSFRFNQLPADKNYTIKFDSNDPSLKDVKKILLSDAKGNVVKELVSNGTGFEFKLLAADNIAYASMKVEDVELKMDLGGKLVNGSSNKPMANVKINLINTNNEVVVSTSTDATGAFNFTKLNSDVYNVKIDEKENKIPAKTKLVLSTNDGKPVKEAVADGGTFNFEMLPSDQSQLANVYYDDPWLQLTDPKKLTKEIVSSLVVKESMYFNGNDAVLLPEAKRVIDKIIDVMSLSPNIIVELSAHTDSKGSDQYNMQLSQKRAKAAVDYIISTGIDKSRISGKGFGETKLVNKCGNGVDCPEDEHAKNRRLEFNITLK